MGFRMFDEQAVPNIKVEGEFKYVKILPPESGFVVGCNDEPCLGVGWHEREIRESDSVAYRAVDSVATFSLQLPGGKALILKILMTAPVPFLDCAYSGTLFMGQNEVGKIEIAHDNWVIRRFELGWNKEPRTMQFTLRSAQHFVPAEKLDSNRDVRRIACYVGAVVVEEIKQ